MYAAYHRRQMRHKGQAHRLPRYQRKTLGNFRQMPMAVHRIGFKAFAGFAHQGRKLRFTPCAADAGLHIGYQMIDINQVVFK